MMASKHVEIPFDNTLCKAVISALEHTASQIILPHFGKLDADMVRTKTSDTDFVTVADTKAEHYLESVLCSVIEGATIIGEESESRQSAHTEQWPDGVVWVIDPLDGTKNFVNKNNNFCSMVTLVHDGVAESAWIYRTVQQDCFFAQAGKGVYHLSGDKIQKCTPAGQASFEAANGTANAMGFDEPLRAEVRARLKTHKGRFHIGSAGLDAVAIAQGRSEFIMHSKLTPWDSLPVSLFAQALGFVVKMADDETDFTPLKTGVLLIARDEAMWQSFKKFVYYG